MSFSLVRLPPLDSELYEHVESDHSSLILDELEEAEEYLEKKVSILHSSDILESESHINDSMSKLGDSEANSGFSLDGTFDRMASTFSDDSGIIGPFDDVVDESLDI